MKFGLAQDVAADLDALSRQIMAENALDVLRDDLEFAINSRDNHDRRFQIAREHYNDVLRDYPYGSSHRIDAKARLDVAYVALVGTRQIVSQLTREIERQSRQYGVAA